MDRLLDDRFVDHALVLAAPEFLRLYIERLGRTFDSVAVQKMHPIYYRQYSVAQVWEWKSNRSLAPITGDDITMLSWKSAPVSLPTHLALHSMNERSRDAVLDAFMSYCAGLQLMDDVADMAEDYDNGISSIPVRLTLTRGLGVGAWPLSGELSGAELADAAYRSGSVRTSLILARSFFETAIVGARSVGFRTLLGLAEARESLCTVRIAEPTGA
ncbi:hypothetical protein CH253_13020 [Rhodococcus sp. 06-156-3C]|uniref:hypothetical protein n=1 Tax=Nocardiaceae TaxID=85025 RepID=UPI000522F755|nr:MULTISPECIES: hypothetical protein [Rhodococcus]OZD09951.1 hypothetical protein CH280_22380 [Rhodococcus sp. 06-156-4C]OZD21856.1 hypothetical protein CH253_13020 [Rhodococcus sp. 06-156-3C]OZD24111.1 hypothetical protein CH248_06000 [Rhodococcus sp. 06-156-4a]OZD29416.1 hypothetical protein CH247_18145 [Rhodococcus sp. 06-156-3b]OZD29618.1 hypothetical protein CH284_25945 [Rhodococcus sp. 06-156-3]